MTTIEYTGMNPALKAKMQEVCDRIAKGILPTMEERNAAAARIDRMREENAKLFGIRRRHLGRHPRVLQQGMIDTTALSVLLWQTISSNSI